MSHIGSYTVPIFSDVKCTCWKLDWRRVNGPTSHAILHHTLNLGPLNIFLRMTLSRHVKSPVNAKMATLVYLTDLFTAVIPYCDTTKSWLQPLSWDTGQTVCLIMGRFD